VTGCRLPITNMLDHSDIYHHHAALYDQLVSREDYQGNIARELENLGPLAGLDVVDMGAGTGRLARLLAPVASSIVAFDRSAAMLQHARTRLTRPHCPLHLAVADHRHLPLAGRVADLVVSGWSICYTVLWHPQNWQTELARALAEMARVARPGGTLIVLETLGTGSATPYIPEKLRSYYQALESAGFANRWIRTDYRFASLAEAERLTRFFFDQRTTTQIRPGTRPILPECTGIWHKTV
jgi:ubiquinone/menaquinone biosynthesis C-methylase UbiE